MASLSLAGTTANAGSVCYQLKSIKATGCVFPGKPVNFMAI
ncbi:hypothetical protein FOXYSP1_00438 [Fusarium oxysporum f. sp. phaseoli]